MDMESKILDTNAIHLGVSLEQLMENAGKTIASEAEKHPCKKWLVLCGGGNNGGDGYVAARYLKRCHVISISKPRTALAAKNHRRAKAIGIPIDMYTKETFDKILGECDGIIDAMLGVGITGPLKQPYDEIVDTINTSNTFVLSVDVPTGFKTDAPLRPNMTVTFHFKKDGLDETHGIIKVADIGIPSEAEEYVGVGEFHYYPPSKKLSHKGNNGIVTVIGGGPYSGAPALAGIAALRTGCDLTYVCSPFPTWQIIASFSPNLIVRKMEGAFFSSENIYEIEDIIKKSDAILVGPGLGDDVKTIDACQLLIKEYISDIPFVVDADAIKSIRDINGQGNLLITPHAREFAEFSDTILPDDLDEKKVIVKDIAKKFNATILLKGPTDIISDGESIKMNNIHNVAMTVGGTGDVLAGICVSLLSKEVVPFHAACMAALTNGLAGNMVYQEKKFGLLARDIIDKIPLVIKQYIS